MTQVTPTMVKELRESTGAGMADCKKALDNCSGDMEKAIVFLREKGLAAAAKKAGRAASEGVVSAILANNYTKGFLVEVNCETDFVTRNEAYQALVKDVEAAISKNQPKDLDALLQTKTNSGATVNESVTALVAKIGENIQVRRFVACGDGKTFVNSYVHMGGKVGVLVELYAEGIDAKRSDSQLEELSKDIALQIAAMKPLYLNREAISAAALKIEEEVFANQYRNQGKPENIIPKIVASRVQTWFKEACLVDQQFVKDEGKDINAVVNEAAKKLGLNGLKIVRFERLELGQGVEKKSVDFATEVAQQISAVTN